MCDWKKATIRLFVLYSSQDNKLSLKNTQDEVVAVSSSSTFNYQSR